MKKHLALLSLIAALAVPARAQELQISWLLAWGVWGGGPGGIEKTTDAKTITLPRSGWSCSLSAVARTADSGTRSAVCTKGTERFEFGATCDDKKRPFSRSQLRFQDPAGGALDYISIECDTSAKPFAK